ncbi:hypothetical protein P7L54_21400 [Acinetobacter bereziniae]|nr:hypothetical protein [Acinetobacter bereziniae]MDG3558489.1 hypothetical protein [Acinetobacter bereziniae]
MAITVFSKTLNRELDLEKLSEFYEENIKNDSFLDFRSFVSSDVLCPSCRVDGAILVVSPDSKRQKHVTFKNLKGQSAHLENCDLANSLEKTDVTLGVELKSKENIEVTRVIRKYICAGIELNFFDQSDIEKMRDWTLEMRSKKDFLVEDNLHYLNLLHFLVIRSDRNRYRYTTNPQPKELAPKDIEIEVYKSLAHKIETPEIPVEYQDLASYKTVVKKAISLIKSKKGTYCFDPTILDKKYKTALHLSLSVIAGNKTLREKLGIRGKSKPIMAYCSLLLFVSDWDGKKALEKHKKIMNLKEVRDDLSGNVIGGEHPFSDYDAWKLLKFVSNMNEKSEWFNNIEEDFLHEKLRMQSIHSALTK